MHAGSSSAFGSSRVVDNDLSHLMPKSHAIAQLQHHNEILAQIQESRVSYVASAIQASKKVPNYKVKEIEKLGKIVD